MDDDQKKREAARGKLDWWAQAFTHHSDGARLTTWREDAKVIATLDRETAREVELYAAAVERIARFFKSRKDQ